MVDNKQYLKMKEKFLPLKLRLMNDFKRSLTRDEMGQILDIAIWQGMESCQNKKYMVSSVSSYMKWGLKLAVRKENAYQNHYVNSEILSTCEYPANDNKIINTVILDQMILKATEGFISNGSFIVLTEKERNVINYLRKFNQKDIPEELNVSKAVVCERKIKALHKMRLMMKKYEPHPVWCERRMKNRDPNRCGTCPLKGSSFIKCQARNMPKQRMKLFEHSPEFLEKLGFVPRRIRVARELKGESI